MPQISVIIPVYNVEACLEQCVRSVLVQTLKDIEVICVDSISTDNSPLILQRLAEEDNRVKVFTLEKIRGLGRGRNCGLDHACGEYVFFLDSDDFLAFDALEKLYHAAKKENLDVVSCHHYEYDDKTHAVTVPSAAFDLCDKDFVSVPPDSMSDLAAFAFASPFGWGKLFRKDIIDKYQLRFPDGAVEDVPFSVFYLAACKKARKLPDLLVYYRTGRIGSISGKNDRMLLDGIKNFGVLEQNLRKHGVFEQVKETFWFNKMVLLIGDERVFAGRLGNVPTKTVQQAYDLIRTDVLSLEPELFIKRNAWFRWKVQQLQKALRKNDLKFPRRLRKLRNIAMIFLDPYFKLKNKISHSKTPA